MMHAKQLIRARTCLLALIAPVHCRLAEHTCAFINANSMELISDWEHAELLDRTTPELPLVPTGLIWGTQGDPLSRPSVAQLTFGRTPEGR
ncbi:hypothetical protein V8E53_002831 [Lactarius tabidus]